MKRKKGIKHRQRLRAAVVRRDGARCAICGVAEVTSQRGKSGFITDDGLPISRVWQESSLELDHRTALKDGGEDRAENCQLLCAECHKEKTLRERRIRARGGERQS